MGCDGGTIPKRHELVKGPRKVEKVRKGSVVAGGLRGEGGSVRPAVLRAGHGVPGAAAPWAGPLGSVCVVALVAAAGRVLCLLEGVGREVQQFQGPGPALRSQQPGER